MRSLADVLAGRGWRLSGSDLAADTAGHFAGAGVRVCRGHAAENLAGRVDLVVRSDAVPDDVPELCKARQLGIPVWSYFETLGRLTANGRGLAVAGTHGKSTTTAMAARLLIDAGLNPTVICGATPAGSHSGGRPGRSDLTLVEACEYRANFTLLRPSQAVILGIEPDHFDCYRSIDELEAAFRRFGRLLPDDGLLLVRQECTATARATAGLRCRRETFGLEPGADWSALGLDSRRGIYSFAIFRHGRHLVDVRLSVPGRHNVTNALASAALAWHNGVTARQIAQGLARFAGLGRRLEQLGSWRGVALLDDYAHHPTEVAASLRTARQMYPGRRLWCVFQPHQASRTEHLLDELAWSLQNADKVVVAEIFRAREPAPLPGEVTAADLAARVAAGRPEVLRPESTERTVSLLKSRLRPGDVLITMGAGDIGKIQDGFIERTGKNRAAG